MVHLKWRNIQVTSPAPPTGPPGRGTPTTVTLGAQPPGQGGTESPLWGWGPLPAPGVQLKVPPQVAGMWHTVAMAASNMLLLDAESGPLRVYVEELKPTPEGDLEILLQKRWVFSPPTWNSPSPGLWTPPPLLWNPRPPDPGSRSCLEPDPG